MGLTSKIVGMNIDVGGIREKAQIQLKVGPILFEHKIQGRSMVFWALESFKETDLHILESHTKMALYICSWYSESVHSHQR